MVKDRQVIAAVSSPEVPISQLQETIEPLLDAGFSSVVLMTSRTINTTQEAKDYYSNNVEIIDSASWQTAGEQRNLILGSSAIKAAGENPILYFTSAGVKLSSSRVPEMLRSVFNNPGSSIGVVGGLVFDEGETLMAHNFGPNLAGPVKIVKAYGSAALLEIVNGIGKINPKFSTKLRKHLGFALSAWPDPYNPPEHQLLQEVGWTYEGSLAIPLEHFKETGGFPHYEVHGTQVLSRELSLRGLKSVIDTRIRSRIYDQTLLPGKSPASLQGILTAMKIAAHYSHSGNRQVTMG